MPLGPPDRPIEPVPAPVDRVRPIPRERASGPRWNLVQGFSRYLRYRAILNQRKRRPKPEPAPEEPPSGGFDTKA